MAVFWICLDPTERPAAYARQAIRQGEIVKQALALGLDVDIDRSDSPCIDARITGTPSALRPLVQWIQSDGRFCDGFTVDCTPEEAPALNALADEFPEVIGEVCCDSEVAPTS